MTHQTPDETTMDTIIGRAIRDEEFRRKFLAHPLKAAEEEGYKLSEADKIGLERLNMTLAADFLNIVIRPGAPVMWCTDQKCYEIESDVPPGFGPVINPERGG